MRPPAKVAAKMEVAAKGTALALAGLPSLFYGGSSQ